MLDLVYGEGTAELLLEESRITAKFSILHIKELLKHYQNLVEEEKRDRFME